MAREWESLNAKAELARMHRDGHCHETMVQYRPLEDVVACSPTLEESYRRATTQKPIREGGSLVSPGLASQRDRFLTAKQGRLLYQRHSVSTPRCRGVGTPSWAGPLTTSLRGLWVSGYLSRAMADRARGRRPENRPGGGRLGPRAGIQKRTRPKLPTNVLLSNQRGLQHTKRDGGPKIQLCQGKGPENPGVVAPLAVAGCRGNRMRAVDRRLGKFDLRPCPLRLWSSLLVLGCTGLMRSKGFRRIQFIEKVLNFLVVPRKRRTYNVTFQNTDETPQMQFLDKLMTSVVVQRLVPGRDGADNCGGSAVA